MGLKLVCCMKAITDTDTPPPHDGQFKTCPECGGVWMFFYGMWRFMSFAQREGA